MSAIVSPAIVDWPSTVTGYWPEFVEGYTGDCYCGAKVRGRTVYWNGTTVLTRYQCRDHLPVEPAIYQAVKR
jgi:hypothetical protein